MSKRFTDRVVVITGAAAGLGRTSAYAFAREGARQLILVDLNHEGLGETAAEARKLGAACSIHRVDLSVEAEIQKFGEELCSQHPEIHVLYNNAGAAYGEVNQFIESVGMEKWLKYLAINSLSPLLLSVALRPSLARAKGVILNQTSMASFVPATIYGVTKATLNSLTYGMAQRFAADGIRVNAIAPGIMETPNAKASLPPETYARVQAMQLLKLQGTADDIANLALFLASDDARFITCEVVSCDAGNPIRGWRY
jgi:NAD(P)-dependent dehydrogenase (short-subunit alcohol dehydrogenase family)